MWLHLQSHRAMLKCNWPQPFLSFLREAITETDKCSHISIHPDLGSGWSTLSRHQLHLIQHPQHPDFVFLLLHLLLSHCSLSACISHVHNSDLTIAWLLQLPFVLELCLLCLSHHPPESCLRVVLWCRCSKMPEPTRRQKDYKDCKE